MSTRLTDSQIERLIGERKNLPDDYRSRLRLREKRGHDEQELEIQGERRQLVSDNFAEESNQPSGLQCDLGVSSRTFSPDVPVAALQRKEP